MNTSVTKFFNAISSAINAAAAVESRRAPKARDLRTLGVNPSQFDKIGRNY